MKRRKPATTLPARTGLEARKNHGDLLALPTQTKASQKICAAATVVTQIGDVTRGIRRQRQGRSHIITQGPSVPAEGKAP
jgi:hypothetical protein